jgi:prevent-host-death family protein
MSTHCVTEARNQLSHLIDGAMDGEPVVITRHGHPVVEIKAARPCDRTARETEMAWLEAHRVKLRGEAIDPADLVSKMRDEDWP